MNKTAALFLLSALMGAETVVAKPRPAPKNPEAAQKAPELPAASPWLHWLLEQDGASAAIDLPWTEMVQATANRQAVPFKVSDTMDAAVAAKISSALDSMLPRLNRPDGPVRSARRLAAVPLLVEDEVHAALSDLPGLICEAPAGNDPARLGDPDAASYPAFRLTEQTSHHVYYLGVGFYPTGHRESPAVLLRVEPKSSASRLLADGTCLLILLEHNARVGAELAFLNWELVDLAQSKVRVQTSFRGAAGEILLPSASIIDGRRGRD